MPQPSVHSMAAYQKARALPRPTTPARTRLGAAAAVNAGVGYAAASTHGGDRYALVLDEVDEATRKEVAAARKAAAGECPWRSFGQHDGDGGGAQAGRGRRRSRT